MDLSQFFRQCPKAALGFSGGVDSAYLLYAAVENGAQVQPYFVKTAFQPQFELEDARRLCAQLGVELSVLELDIFNVPPGGREPSRPVLFLQKGAVWPVEGTGPTRWLQGVDGWHQCFR